MQGLAHLLSLPRLSQTPRDSYQSAGDTGPLLEPIPNQQVDYTFVGDAGPGGATGYAAPRPIRDRAGFRSPRLVDMTKHELVSVIRDKDAELRHYREAY